MLAKTDTERNGFLGTIGKYTVFIETNRKVINETFIRDFLKRTSIPFNRNLGDDVIISRLKNTPHYKVFTPATLTPKTYSWSIAQQTEFNLPPSEIYYDISTKNSFGSYHPNEIEYIIM